MIKTVEQIIKDFKKNYREEDIKNLQLACEEVEKADRKLVELGYYVICVEEVKKDICVALWDENKAFSTLKKM